MNNIKAQIDHMVMDATRGVDEQREALKALYASIEHRSPISMHDYLYIVVKTGFEVTPIKDINGEIIGAALTRGDEVHLGVTRRPRGSQRRLVHEVLDPIIKQYGYAKTRVKHDNLAGSLFCRRLGFVATVSTEDATHYICTRPTHA